MSLIECRQNHHINRLSKPPIVYIIIRERMIECLRNRINKKMKLIIEMLAALMLTIQLQYRQYQKTEIKFKNRIKRNASHQRMFEENDFKLSQETKNRCMWMKMRKTRNYIKELVDMDENKPVYSAKQIAR